VHTHPDRHHAQIHDHLHGHPQQIAPIVGAAAEELPWLLAGTAALAVHARLRLIPNLTDETLSGLAWHIRGITALAIAFVVMGALIRLGGLG
jgi:hypothetical protein